MLKHCLLLHKKAEGKIEMAHFSDLGFAAQSRIIIWLGSHNKGIYMVCHKPG